MAQIERFEYVIPGRGPVLFRTVLAADAAQYVAFRERIARETNHTLLYPGMNAPTGTEHALRFEMQANDIATLNIGVFSETEMLAYLNFRLPYGDHPWCRHLGQFGMMVVESHWNCGLGKKLLQVLDSHALAVGVTRIEAMVRTANSAAVKLYLRAGYKIEGTRRDGAFIDGEFRDEYFIAKRLNDPLRGWQPPQLETQRLILRALALSDAKDVFAYASDPEVSRYTLWSSHQSEKDSRDFIQDYALAKYSQGVPEPYAIVLKSDPKKVIGTVGCFWVSKEAKVMELAYVISKDHWGKGLVAEASEAVMRFCVEHFKLKRIQARCKVENMASARVMEKLGMEREGILRSSLFAKERHWDLFIYSKIYS